VAETRPLAPDGVLKLVLSVVGGYDEENVVQLGVAVMLEVADVGGDLLAQPSQRLSRPVPLQVEQDAAAGRQIDPAAVGRGDRPLVLASRRSALSPDVLFAVPDSKPSSLRSRLCVIMATKNWLASRSWVACQQWSRASWLRST
jgi:hypothetical protein